MIKIIIMSEDEITKKTIRDIEARRVQKEDLIIYFHSLKDFRRMLVQERVRVLGTVKNPNPQLLSTIARLLKRNFKSITVDAKLLSQLRLLTPEEMRKFSRKAHFAQAKRAG